MQFAKARGPIDIDWEVGYNAVHLGPDGWIAVGARYKLRPPFCFPPNLSNSAC